MKDIDKVIKWYEEKRALYVLLAPKVEGIIRESLDQDKIPYDSVTSRAKSLESFTSKAKKDKYSDPINEIKDLAGIRVITYLESDVQKVAEIVEKLFVIDKSNSIDQSKLLGSDRVGYRSVHYIAEFTKTRCKLPEFKLFKNLPFEIQIRSLLQHAWAEIEHDRNYKFIGKLPTELERRFYLVAGMLESADREFVSIADEIDKYKVEVIQELKKEDLNIDINTVSLKEYLSTRFSELIAEDLVIKDFSGDAKIVVEEILLFGIRNLSEFDRIIPKDFRDNILNLKLHPKLDFASMSRYILIISDVKKYFEVSWRKSWHFIKKDHKKLLNKYNVDLVYLRKRVGLNL